MKQTKVEILPEAAHRNDGNEEVQRHDDRPQVGAVAGEDGDGGVRLAHRVATSGAVLHLQPVLHLVPRDPQNVSERSQEIRHAEERQYLPAVGAEVVEAEVRGDDDAGSGD